MQANTEFDRWVDDFTADWVRHHPVLATTQQYFEGPEQDALDRRLTLAFLLVGPYGSRAAQVQVVLARRGLAGLRAFSPADLSDVQQTSAAVIEQRLEAAIAGAKFAQHRFIFNQIVGLHVMLVNFLSTAHPIRGKRDAENYLARLALVPECLDEGVGEAREAAAATIVPPRFILERTIEQLDALMSGDLAQHVLVATFERRLAELTAVSAERRAEFVAAALTCVRDRIVPAFGRVRAMLVEQLAHTDDGAGAWRLPNGADFYANELATLTGSSLSAREIHALGLREVARIEAEMDDVLRRIGYADGPLQARIDQVNETLRWPADPDPREAILARLEDILGDAVLRSAAVFELRPKAPVTVKREPAFSERSAAAHYSTPAPDGSQPGIYWVPLADVGPNVPWLGISMKSVAYHEAIPGHHFQLAIEQESPDLPRFRKLGAFGYDPSYAEGWALYSEHLTSEFDWYGDDLAARLGFLQMQLFRARRLVVDTGLHDLQWTRQQAIDYGFPASEIERYVIWPGQACSYMIGQLRILEIRERARAALGDRFSMKAFHNVVLSRGTLPLAVLAREVEAWTESLLST